MVTPSRLSFLFSFLLISCLDSESQSFATFHPVSKEPAGNVYAIVVGISAYHYIKPLSYADKDAELFADLLRFDGAGGIKPENLFLLKNDSANAGNFWSSLARINNKALKPGDRVYIYFAGHGDAVKGLNEYYLLLSDCQPANDGNNYLLSFSAIDMYKLKNRIGLMTGKGVEVILVLDACRTNELAGGYASQVFNSSIIQTKVGEIAMLATGPGQVSIEDASFGPGHGLFTYYLVDAFSGAADRDGGNDDNRITLGEINNWVSQKVRMMSARFKIKQEPVFCCDNKNNTTMGIVDSNFILAWNQLKQHREKTTVSPAKTQRGNDMAADTALLELYNQFNTARKENRLWGEGSADQYYDLMQSRFGNERLTEDARYALAADFINFAQQKINLYLEGKDILSVDRLRDNTDTVNTPNFLSDEYDRLRKTVSEKWTITAMMIQKAGKLLSSENDSTFLLQLKPKINFLLARGYLGKEKENKLNFEQALRFAREAWSSDSSAAYTAECLGLLYAYRHSFNRQLGISETEYEMGTLRGSDTSMVYFKKAISLAPKWVSPYRSIGVKIYGQLMFDSAIHYLKKALSLDPTDGTTNMLIGDTYKQIFPDSALYYYRRSLQYSGRSSHALLYRKIAGTFLVPAPRNSPFFKPDSVLYYANLSLAAAQTNMTGDQMSRSEVLRDIYINIAHVYSTLGKQDSSIKYWYKVLALFPDNLRAVRVITAHLLANNKPDSALFYFNRVLLSDPKAGIIAADMGRYYDIKGISDSAIHYYKSCLMLGFEKDYCRERLGFLLMAKDKNDPLALEYFTASARENPNAWRQYYNIACYHANREDELKALEFLERSLQLGMKNKKLLETDPYFDRLRQGESFKKLLAKYLPG